jgi:mRNA-degrading endonuclease toxin of MazEF toxin-antitoxin module
LRVGFHGLEHEMDGEHPGIFAGFSSGVQFATMIPLTSNMEARLSPATMVIKRTPSNGLRFDSVAVVHQMTCIDPQFILQKLGGLDPRQLAELQGIIKSHLHLT